MKKIFWAAIVLAILTAATPAMCGVLFYDDCEKAFNPNDWAAIGTYQNYSYNNISLSSEQARSGSHSFKFQLNTQENLNASDWNDSAHVNLGKTNMEFSFNKTFWVGFSIYVPSDFVMPTSSNWLTFFEFHGPWDCPYNSGLPVAQYNGSGGSSVSIEGSNDCSEAGDAADRHAGYSMSWRKGAWNDVVINCRFSYTSGGFFKMWVNGNQVANDSGVNTWPGTPWLKIGLYGRPNVPTAIYFDEIRIGDANATYDDVAPQGSSSASTSSPSSSTTTSNEDLAAPTLSIVK